MKVKSLGLTVLVLAVGGFLVSGCCMPSGLSDTIGQKVGNEVEKGIKKSIENETGVKVESGDSAETSGEDLKNVPRYTGSKRTFYIKGEPIDGKVSISITYQTSDDIAKVVSWYKDKMAEKGWAVTTTVGGNDGGEMVIYETADKNSSVTVNIAKSNDKTDITVLYNGIE